MNHGINEQILVKTLCGRTHVLSAELENVPQDTLVKYIQTHVERIVSSDTILDVRTSTGRRLGGQKTCQMLQGTTLFCFLPLLGGKGGFGSTLRAGGKKHKHDDNVDACRDLQGRRIRMKTAENTLKEWKETAGERELEKVALEYMKKSAREAKEKDIEKSLEEVDDGRELKKKVLKDVKGAVSAGLESSRAVDTVQGTIKDKFAAFQEDSDDDTSEDESS